MSKRVPMNGLKELLGHANIATTAEFYLGISDDVAEQVQAAFTARVLA